MIRVGVLGLPFSGKSTFMRALALYSKAHHTPEKLVIRIPDKRLERLAEIYSPEKVTNVEMEFLELGSLDPGDPRVSRSVLMKVQEVDCTLVILRGFESERVPTLEGYEDPKKQLEFILNEFHARDLGIIDGRIERLENSKRKLTNLEEMELSFLKRFREHLESSYSIPEDLGETETKMLSGYSLVLTKGKTVLLNIGENEKVRGDLQRKVRDLGIGYFEMPVKLVGDLYELEDEEREAFMEEYGLEDPGIEGLIREIVRSLNMGFFYTVKGKEIRAWEMKLGSTALEVAGTIHSDMARGFIRAEIFSFEDLDREGSEKALREKGLVKLVGKDHVVSDGDIVFVKFNV